jgi:hypothetical protein
VEDPQAVHISFIERGRRAPIPRSWLTGLLHQRSYRSHTDLRYGGSSSYLALTLR